jgi:DNA-binding NarL/FixJ family response regulator
MSERYPIAVVADDHELCRAGIAAMLKRDLGFLKVVEAGSFDEAFDCIGRIPDVTVAVFDLAMPGMQGAASLEQVRRCFPGLRVAVVSASASRQDILLALAAGVHGYIPKTMGLEQIARALALVLGGHVFVPPDLTELSSDASTPPPIGECTAGPATKIDELTSRELEVLRYMAAGKSNKEIARALNLAEGTIKAHVYSLFRTLSVRNRVSAAALLRSSATGTKLNHTAQMAV